MPRPADGHLSSGNGDRAGVRYAATPRGRRPEPAWSRPKNSLIVRELSSVSCTVTHRAGGPARSTIRSRAPSLGLRTRSSCCHLTTTTSTSRSIGSCRGNRRAHPPVQKWIRSRRRSDRRRRSRAHRRRSTRRPRTARKATSARTAPARTATRRAFRRRARRRSGCPPSSRPPSCVRAHLACRHPVPRRDRRHPAFRHPHATRSRHRPPVFVRRRPRHPHVRPHRRRSAHPHRRFPRSLARRPHHPNARRHPHCNHPRASPRPRRLARRRIQRTPR